jgi:hypothetical protein
VSVPHRSVSQLTSWVRCGEAYRLERIARAPEVPAAWTLQGTAVHAAVEHWELSGQTASLEETLGVFYASWDTGFTKMQKAEPDLDLWRTGTPRTKGGTDAARRRQRGAEQVAAYIGYRRDDPFKIWAAPDGRLAVELKFRIELGGIEVLGYIDQVLEAPDGSLRVRDLKTGTKLPESAFQLGVYAEAVEQAFGVRPAYGDFFMCKNNAPTDAFDLSGYTTERLGRWFARLDRAINAGAFIPNPGDACRTCGVARFCDAVGSDRETYGGSDLD